MGVATGDVVAGYTGTQHRAVYTCIGDTVNVASRLEAYTKVAGRRVLVDRATATALNGAVDVEPLGAVMLKGKQREVEIFAPTHPG